MSNEKNTVVSIEELRAIKEKLFKSKREHKTEDSEGQYKGYFVTGIDINGERIFDILEGKGIKIKIWKNIEDDTYDVSLNKGKTEICRGFGALLSKKNINELEKYNVGFTDTQIKVFKRLLHRIAEDDRNCLEYHNGVGFTDDNSVFKFVNAVEMNGENVELNSQLRFEDETAKKNIGKMGRSKCTKETFRDGVNSLIVHNPYLSLALCINLYGFLQQYLTNADYVYKRMNLSINFTGTTKIGKTTMSRLCNMLYGLPNELMINYSITDFELDNKLSSYNIIPTVVDDIAVGVANDSVRKTVKFFIEKIFRVASGETRKSKISAERRYYSPLVTSTERSIVRLLTQKSANADGYIRRLLEIRSEHYTDSIEHAHKIDEFVNQNYGMIADVAEFMSKNNITADVINEQFREYETNFMNLSLLKEKGFADRLALLAISGEMINNVFGTELDITAMMKAVIENINLAVDDMERFETDRFSVSTFGRDSAREICGTLEFYATIAVDKENYVNQYKKGLECIGFKDEQYLYIKGEDTLRNQIEFKGNREDFKNLLNELKMAGVLIPGTDGVAKTAKVIVDGSRTNYYRFSLEKLNEMSGDSVYKYVADICVDEEDF